MVWNLYYMLVWDIYYKVNVYLHILNVNTFSIIKLGQEHIYFKGNNEKKNLLQIMFYFKR